MTTIVYVVIFLVGLIAGLTAGVPLTPRIQELMNYESHCQMKAIQEEFNCQKNEFTYFFEDNDDFYIVTVNNQEYRIKFSKKKPCKVIYSQQVVID
ncbi:hypothetical protein [Carnobacterium divergens]|uniref:hypothetical protein n=1 Tax=Carnobacterium divergens TaxID=2748 RepID=UPI0039C8F59C